MSEETLYQETYRPQFHFTAKANWLNDPNGLVYYDGVYHLFFQHNPKGLQWGPNTWGHAISSDLVHWTQLEDALVADELGWIWSGSAVVDWQNTSGLKTGDAEVLVAFYTTGDSISQPQKPCVQCIAASNDGGSTWIKYSGNPVLGHIAAHNRDPRVFWYAPTQQWVMALFLDGHDFALFKSRNLREWTKIDDIHLPATGECPDMFELMVDGDADDTQWIFWGGNGNYLIGSFDGSHFEAESEVLRADQGANFYAAQTWSDIPALDGRCIQIAWMSGGEYPGMPFNQQMSFPCELTLRRTPNGIRLCRQPVEEIKRLRRASHHWRDERLEPGRNLLSDLSGELLDIRVLVEPEQAEEVSLTVRGVDIRYHVREQQLHCLGRSVALLPVNDCIELRVLVDRTSLEVFGNQGLLSMSSCFLPDPNMQRLGMETKGGSAYIGLLEVHELASVWTS